MACLRSASVRALCRTVLYENLVICSDERGNASKRLGDRSVGAHVPFERTGAASKKGTENTAGTPRVRRAEAGWRMTLTTSAAYLGTPDDATEIRLRVRTTLVVNRLRPFYSRDVVWAYIAKFGVLRLRWVSPVSVQAIRRPGILTDLAICSA